MVHAHTRKYKFFFYFPNTIIARIKRAITIIYMFISLFFFPYYLIVVCIVCQSQEVADKVKFKPHNIIY